MPGVAAFVNPSVSSGDSVLLFFNTDNNNLGLGLFSGKSTRNDGKYFTNVTSSTAITGPIIKSSPLGAGYVDGINVVVGFTKSGTASTPTGVDVSMISPVYQTLTTTGVDFWKAISITSTGGTPGNESTGAAYIYYLNINSNNNAKLADLKEYALDRFNTSTVKNNPNVAAFSQLASYYVDDSTRYVFYQGTNSNIFEFEVVAGDSKHINSALGANQGSPLAVTYDPASKTTFLYYVDSDNNITRVIKQNDKWGSAVNLDWEIDPSSQITVVFSNGAPHVFYLPANPNGTNFSHQIDTKAVGK